MRENTRIKRTNQELIPYSSYELTTRADESQSRLRLYIESIFRRKLLVLAIVFSCAVLAFINALTETPVYKAITSIQISLDKTKILPYQEIRDASPYLASEKYIQTQCSVLMSRTLANRVVRKLNLGDNPAFVGEKKSLFSKKPKAGETDATVSERASALAPVESVGVNSIPAAYTDRFLRNLEVIPSIQRSQIIQIHYNSTNPQLAADIANALTKEYIQLNLETQYESTQQAMEFLSKQITEMRTKVAQADEALLNYARTYDLSPPSEKDKTPAQQDLQNIKTALTDAKMERIRKESLYKIIKESNVDDPMPSSVKNTRINALEERLADLKQREASLTKRFRNGWPEHADLQAQMAEVERQMEEEKARIINVIKKDYAESVQREEMLTGAVEHQQAVAMQTQENSIQYNILRREVEINKQLLEGMLQRLKEATVSSSLNASNVTVLDRADAPQMPFKPNKKMQLLYGLLLGLVLGVGLVLAMENMSDTVKTPEEVNHLVQLPVLGVIPYISKSSERGRMLPMKKSIVPLHASPMYTITFDDARSPISEAFRVVRTSILLSHEAKNARILLFTSPYLGDGKSTLAHNVAIALTQVNRSVVLVDCDLRRPGIHKTFDLSNATGMSAYLSGEAELTAVIQETRIPKLYAIPSGAIPLNPSELLTSERMDMALEHLSQKFDYVIIDSPPLLMVTDGYVLSSIVDGVILVAKADKLPKDALQRTKQNLTEVNAKILGVVLNKMDSRGARYGYGGYYQYGDAERKDAP